MQITDEMVEAARNIINDPRMRAALEAALGAAIQQPVRIQDPRVLAESLIVLGPSSDGAVERDLRHAQEQQADCIEDLAAAIISIRHGLSIHSKEDQIARATLERWGLK